MLTFEITGSISEAQMHHLKGVALSVERIDALSVNVTVDDEAADGLTDWIDRQMDPYLTYRMV